MGKKNKTISIDEEVYEKCKDVNASELINQFLKDHFRLPSISNHNYSESKQEQIIEETTLAMKGEERKEEFRKLGEEIKNSAEYKEGYDGGDNKGNNQ